MDLASSPVSNSSDRFETKSRIIRLVAVQTFGAGDSKAIHDFSQFIEFYKRAKLMESEGWTAELNYPLRTICCNSKIYRQSCDSLIGLNGIELFTKIYRRGEINRRHRFAHEGRIGFDLSPSYRISAGIVTRPNCCHHEKKKQRESRKWKSIEFATLHKTHLSRMKSLGNLP